MPAPSSLPEKLAGAWPPERWRDVTVLAAVSGGADSVALARALVEVRQPGEGRLVLAHFNHRLRGEESDGDQRFVEQLAEHLGLSIVTGHAAADLAASGSGQGLEGAARQARYDFLLQAAGQAGARHVATAHTADDQVETILHNLLRGTGLAGLAGIPRLRRLSEAATLVRPLLEVTRAEVLAYLAALNQPFREDSSNFTTDFTRNRLRHELVPLLERDYNPRVREALQRLSQIAGEADLLLSELALSNLEAVGRAIPGGIEIDAAAMCRLPTVVARYLLMGVWQRQGWPLQEMSFEKWEQLRALAAQPSAAMDFPSGVRAERRDAMLRLRKAQP